MVYAEIETRVTTVEKEIIRLRDRQEDSSKEIVELQGYSKRIEGFPGTFGRIFTAMGKIEVAIGKQGVKIHYVTWIISMVVSMITAVGVAIAMKFILPS